MHSTSPVSRLRLLVFDPGNDIVLKTASTTLLPWQLHPQLNLYFRDFKISRMTRLRIRDTASLYLMNSISPYAIVDSAFAILDSNSFNSTVTFLNAVSEFTALCCCQTQELN
ncbi:MAG: hypothetical protein IPG99_11670 [Ignavibacteria bacterium]|nr:hypothetical protein [Ignavibacteria bacterium]